MSWKAAQMVGVDEALFQPRQFDPTNAKDHLLAKLTTRSLLNMNNNDWLRFREAINDGHPVLRDPMERVGPDGYRLREGELVSVLRKRGARLGDKLTTNRVMLAIDQMATFWNTKLPDVVLQYGALMKELNEALEEAHTTRDPAIFHTPAVEAAEFNRELWEMEMRHNQEISELRTKRGRESPRTCH
jgi:hypothetical protein